MASLVRKCPSSIVHEFNIAFGGESHVGKTTIFKTISELKLSDREDYQVYHIADDHLKGVFRHNNAIIKFTLWDTGGLERFRSMTNSYFRSLSCLILIHSTNPNCKLEAMTDWMEKASSGVLHDSIVYSIWSNDFDATSEEETERILQKISCFAQQQGVDGSLCFKLEKAINLKERVPSIAHAFSTTLDAIIEKRLTVNCGSSSQEGLSSNSLNLRLEPSEGEGSRSVGVSRSHQGNSTVHSNGDQVENSTSSHPEQKSLRQRKCC